jgi:hypothetical protein
LINLSDLKHGPSSTIPEKLLEDGCWKQAVFYDLGTESTYWNRASLVSISKAFAKNGSVALLYLLQKEAHILSLWKKEWEDTPPSIGQFINSVLGWGRFSNTLGRNVPADDFWKNFTTILEGITMEKSFEFSKDEIPSAYSEMVRKEDVVQAICFDDTWAEQNYLIETSTSWILYNWVTAA